MPLHHSTTLAGNQGYVTSILSSQQPVRDTAADEKAYEQKIAREKPAVGETRTILGGGTRTASTGPSHVTPHKEPRERSQTRHANNTGPRPVSHDSSQICESRKTAEQQLRNGLKKYREADAKHRAHYKESLEATISEYMQEHWGHDVQSLACKIRDRKDDHAKNVEAAGECIDAVQRPRSPVHLLTLGTQIFGENKAACFSS